MGRGSLKLGESPPIIQQGPSFSILGCLAIKTRVRSRVWANVSFRLKFSSKKQNFHPKHGFFIQMCVFSSISGESHPRKKTLVPKFYYNFRNIVLDSHFWKKKIATLEINHLIKKGWRHYPEDSELLMENRSLTSETW
jgi:hypothetical protein